MGNISIVMVILCASLLPLTLRCHKEEDSFSHEENDKWDKVFVLGHNSSTFHVSVRCGKTHRLAPGYFISNIRPQFSNTQVQQLQDFYLDCIGKTDCSVSRTFIRTVRSLTFPTFNIFDTVMCLPEYLFSSTPVDEHLTISKDYPNYGFILRYHTEPDQGINITLVVEEGQTVFLEFYYTERYFLNTGKVFMNLSGGIGTKCVYIEDIGSIPRVVVGSQNGQVVIFFPLCSNIGRFAINYYRFHHGYTPVEMPSNWTFITDRYTRVPLLSGCSKKCLVTSPTPDSSTSPVSDGVTEAINADRGASAAVIGVSVVAGLLLAAILVVVVIFLLWKRNMLALPVKSTTHREAAPPPPKRKENNPGDEDYSQPYDNVRTPDILNNRNGSNGNLYAEVTKDRSRPPLVTGSSLHIEENDLYPRSGVPRRGPRESASVDIVENDGYDSFGAT